MTCSRIAILLLACCTLSAQDAGKIRVIAFGAHPDDCDIRAGGTAALFARMGHAVKFVAVTNGDAGHQSQGGGALAKRRRAEAMESAKRLGIEYEVLDNHDGELLPTLEVRQQVIRRIRQWNADIVLAPRPTITIPTTATRACWCRTRRIWWSCPTSRRTRRRCAAIRCSCILRIAFSGPIRSGRTLPWPSMTCGSRKSRRSTPTSRRSTSGCRGWMASWRTCPKIPLRARNGWPRRARQRPLQPYGPRSRNGTAWRRPPA